MAAASAPTPVPRSAEQEWERKLTEAARAADRSQFEMGDLVIEFNDAWGDRYTRARQITGRPEKTLKNYVWVCTKVERSRRRDDLTFGHHAVVARLKADEQVAWLEKAAKKDWGVDDLKRKLPSSGGDGDIDPKERIVVLVPRSLYPAFIDATEARGKPEKEMKQKVAEWLLRLGEAALNAKTEGGEVQT